MYQSLYMGILTELMLFGEHLVPCGSELAADVEMQYKMRYEQKRRVDQFTREGTPYLWPEHREDRAVKKNEEAREVIREYRAKTQGMTDNGAIM